MMSILCILLFLGTLYMIYKAEENHSECEKKVEEYESVKEFLGNRRI